MWWMSMRMRVMPQMAKRLGKYIPQILTMRICMIQRMMHRRRNLR